MYNFTVQNITDLKDLDHAKMNDVAKVTNGNRYYKLLGTNPADLHSWKVQLEYEVNEIANVKMNPEPNLKFNSNKLDIEDDKD